MKTSTFLKKYIVIYKWNIVIFVMLSLILWSFSMSTPYIVGQYIDSLVIMSDKNKLWQGIIFLVIIWTLQILFSYIKNIIAAKLHANISFYMNYDLIEHLKQLPIHYFADKNSAYLNQRVSSDSENATTFILDGMTGLFNTILTFFFSLSIIYFLNFKLLLIICFMFPIYIYIYFKFKQPLYDLNYKYLEEQNKFYSGINKQLSNIKLVKQHMWIELMGKELKSSFLELYKVKIKNAKLGYLFNNLDMLLRYFTNIIIFIYSGYHIIEGKMSIGQFTMINSYCTMVISSLSGFLQFGKGYRHFLGVYNRIMDIYQTKKEANGLICVSNISNITISNLNFNYKDRHIIKDFNVEMNQGNIYIIVGRNGSGKSTFIDILSGLIQDYSGKIQFNSINMREIDLYNLRKERIAIVEQEPILYFNTIRKNISHSDEENTAVDNWIQRLKLYDFISSLPNQIDFIVSEKTSNLSGGEKQRIAQARTFVKEADVLIFDEPNSALDKDSLEVLCSILQEIKYNKIIIVITHNKEIMDIGDYVLHLD